MDELMGDLWRATWQSGLLIVVVMAARGLLGRRLSPRWRCGLWLVVAVRLALPVLPASRWSAFNLVPQPVEGRFEPGDFNLTMVMPVNALAPLPVVVPIANFDWLNFLAWVWLAGAGAMLARLSIVNVQFSRRLRFEMEVGSENIHALWRSCAERMGVRGIPPVIVTTAVATPAIFGLWKKRLLLPTDFEQRLSRNELRLVFLHELVHLRNRDVAAGWLMSLLQCVHWFNPLVWIAGICWRADMELACDEAVLEMREPAERNDYGMVLLKLATRISPSAPRPAAGMIGGKGQLRRRIVAIARGERRGRIWSICAAILAAAVIFFGLTDARERVVNAQALVHAPATTQANDDGQRVTMVYSVSDVLIDISHMSIKVVNGKPGTMELEPPDQPGKESELMEMVRGQLKSGQADMQPGDKLVVTAGMQTQRRLRDMLDMIRRERDRRVVVESHVLTIPTDKLAELSLPKELGTTDGPAFMEPQPTEKLFQYAENARVNEPWESSIITAPRFVAFSGERCNLGMGNSWGYVAALHPTKASQTRPVVIATRQGATEIQPGFDAIYTATQGAAQSGIKMELRPTIVGDNKYVSLEIKSTLTVLLGFETVNPGIAGHPDFLVQKPMIRKYEANLIVITEAGETVGLRMKQTNEDSPEAVAYATKKGLPAHETVLLIIKPTILVQNPPPK